MSNSIPGISRIREVNTGTVVLGGTVEREISICFFTKILSPGDLTTVCTNSGTDVPV